MNTVSRTATIIEDPRTYLVDDGYDWAPYRIDIVTDGDYSMRREVRASTLEDAVETASYEAGPFCEDCGYYHNTHPDTSIELPDPADWLASRNS